MSARFSFSYDVDYLLTAFDRYRSQHWFRHVSSLSVALALIFAAGFVYQAIVNNQLIGMVLGVLVFIALFWSRSLMRNLLRRRLLRMNGIGESFVIDVSNQGLHAKGQGQQANLGWNRFSHAVRYADGVLLVQSPQVFNWLPSTALEGPHTLEDVLALIERGLGAGKLRRHRGL